MKALALYVDKWYIVGALCIDGMPRPITLPNKEDRLWLYFKEDLVNDKGDYSKDYASNFCNNELHYFGDIFAHINDSTATFTKFKNQQPLKDIFKSSGMFQHLKEAIGLGDNIPTFVSFAKEIELAARYTFLIEMERAGFMIREKVVRIEHLALEHATRIKGIAQEGYYLVLNACNENLYYSLYKKSDLIVRTAECEQPLAGRGVDLRARCLIEYVVDRINQTERLLKDKAELEREYLRCGLEVETWLAKLASAPLHMPVQITGVTLARDPYKDYHVGVLRRDIDERTKSTTADLVNVVTQFVRQAGVSHEQVAGIIFIGNTFTNRQFEEHFLKSYRLDASQLVCYADSDLPELVSIYRHIDCSQFSDVSKQFSTDAQADLQRIKNAEEQQAAEEKARIALEQQQEETRAKRELADKISEAMERGFDAETQRDYERMAEYFKIARDLGADNEVAAHKYEEALRLKAEKTAKDKHFLTTINQAKEARSHQNWEVVLQKAEEALGANPQSNEARMLKDEATRSIAQAKELIRCEDRFDTFMAQRLFDEAQEELRKAKLLVDDPKALKPRYEQLFAARKQVGEQIAELVAQAEQAVQEREFDEAIGCYNQLIGLDPKNNAQWNAQISATMTLKAQAAEGAKKVRALVAEIDDAHLREDWTQLAERCKKLLAIDPEEGAKMKGKLRLAEDKLEMIALRNKTEGAITEIKTLVAEASFANAWQLFRDLKREVEQSELRQELKREIEDLSRLIFDREQEAHAAKEVKNAQRVERGETVALGSGRSKASSASKSTNRPMRDDDFFDKAPSSRQKPESARTAGKASRAKPKPTGASDSFFDSPNSGIKGTSRGVSNDDFDF